MRLTQLFYRIFFCVLPCTMFSAPISDGFFSTEWDEATGKLWLYVSRLDEEFLYVSSLPAGVGSNDIGLDRGQLSGERMVKFTRSGNKLLLVQMNMNYRAVSDNMLERKAVEEAFAQSVLWGFTIDKEDQGTLRIDFTPFLLRDAHGVSQRLARTNQGTYSVDPSRCAIYLPRTKNFPKNSEFEATITFTGRGTGAWIRSVAPDADAITVRMHHSLIELPDGGYQPRVFDPRSGYFEFAYYDYATPIQQSIIKRYITRHRLHKRDPSAQRSEPVEPIVYYLDPGCPEPIRSALLDGARWWNQAFEAAGYINAFRVEMLPADADPMDVRYNLIQWVHRSTRGWSYGSSVIDPRTGEIIKGQVTLGSLRVRQDFLIAQGYHPAYKNEDWEETPLTDLALARLRQLSAHEVGHTLGLAHNFSASVNQRASVMDYPHPYLQLTPEGKIDLSQMYTTEIGAWDKRTILYGYQHFPSNINESGALRQILEENEQAGLLYLSDQDARPVDGSSPHAHLWDNGTSAASELQRIIQLRQQALKNFSPANIPHGTPMAHLENVLVPLYLAHRYQVEAAVKLIGGVDYNYAVRGSTINDKITIVPPAKQSEALNAVLKTLAPEYLMIPDHIRAYLPPQPLGYERSRENFQSYTGLTFDALGAAESSAYQTLQLLLHNARLARVLEQQAFDPAHVGIQKYLTTIHLAVQQGGGSPYAVEISRQNERLFFQLLLALSLDKSISTGVQSQVSYFLQQNRTKLKSRLSSAVSAEGKAHIHYLLEIFDQAKTNPATFKLPSPKPLPDGAPIGCGED